MKSISDSEGGLAVVLFEIAVTEIQTSLDLQLEIEGVKSRFYGQSGFQKEGGQMLVQVKPLRFAFIKQVSFDPAEL